MAKKIIIPSLVLTVICLVISAALAFTNDITKDKIAENNENVKKQTMSELFSDADFEKQMLDYKGEKVEYYKVIKETQTIGFVFTTSEVGYGGPVEVMTGVSDKGEVVAVSVVSCADETPGLGQSAKGNSDFLGQFKGKNSQISEEKNAEIDALAGATITTKAVIKDVNRALEYYNIVAKEGGK